jgi:uncharacterized membrane protein
MSANHGTAAVGSGMDMQAHEASYTKFIELTKTTMVFVLNIVLMLVLWGIEGHGGVALVGFVLNAIAATLTAFTGQGWKILAPVFVLLGLACILL